MGPLCHPWGRVCPLQQWGAKEGGGATGEVKSLPLCSLRTCLKMWLKIRTAILWARGCSGPCVLSTPCQPRAEHRPTGRAILDLCPPLPLPTPGMTGGALCEGRAWGGVGAHAFHAIVSQLQTQAAKPIQRRRMGPSGPCALEALWKDTLLPRAPSQQGLAGATLRSLGGAVWSLGMQPGAGCSSPLAACHLCSRVSSQPPSSHHGDMRTQSPRAAGKLLRQGWESAADCQGPV